MKFEVKIPKDSVEGKALYKRASEAIKKGKRVRYKDDKYQVYYCGKTEDGYLVGLVQEDDMAGPPAEKASAKKVAKAEKAAEIVAPVKDNEKTLGPKKELEAKEESAADAAEEDQEKEE